jgi:hypothetical protein
MFSSRIMGYCELLQLFDRDEFAGHFGTGSKLEPEAYEWKACRVMVGLVPTIHIFSGRVSRSRRGCSPQGRA